MDFIKYMDFIKMFYEYMVFIKNVFINLLTNQIHILKLGSAG
jgi:hypothetical protein